MEGCLVMMCARWVLVLKKNAQIPVVLDAPQKGCIASACMLDVQGVSQQSHM